MGTRKEERDDGAAGESKWREAFQVGRDR